MEFFLLFVLFIAYVVRETAVWLWGQLFPAKAHRFGHGQTKILNEGYPGRLRRVVGLTQGLVVDPSPHGQHVCWARGGCLFTYYEKDLGHDRWTILEVEPEGFVLPTFQIWPAPSANQKAIESARIAPPAGVPKFDAHYRILIPRSPSRSAPSLPPEFWTAFLDVGQDPDGPVLEVQPARVRLYLPRVLHWGGGRTQFLDRGCRVLDLLLVFARSGAAGVDIRVVSATGSAAGVEICQVCGEGLGDRRVVCARCLTPHHEDCWTYVGTCSVYACRSRDRRADPARRRT